MDRSKSCKHCEFQYFNLLKLILRNIIESEVRPLFPIQMLVKCQDNPYSCCINKCGHQYPYNPQMLLVVLGTSRYQAFPHSYLRESCPSTAAPLPPITWQSSPPISSPGEGNLDILLAQTHGSHGPPGRKQKTQEES